MAMPLPAEVEAAVQRLGRELETVRHGAIEQEAAAKAVLDVEKPALQNKITANRESLKKLEDLMQTWKREEESTLRRLSELEENYQISVQYAHRVAVLPSSQRLLEFVCAGDPDISTAAPSVSREEALAVRPHEDAIPACSQSLTAESGSHPVSPTSVASSMAKRPPEEDLEHQGKRLRKGSTSPIPGLSKKTIDFDKLYDDGNAKYKHRILQYGSDWFILRCDEHDVHFPYKAAVAAGSHLRGYSHGGSSAALPAVIEAFGIRVNGCNKEMAELNNERF